MHPVDVRESISSFELMESKILFSKQVSKQSDHMLLLVSLGN